MRQKQTHSGFTLIETLVGIFLAALMLMGVQATLKWATRTDSQIEISDELRELRTDATRRIDCNQSIKVAPLCTPKDKKGNPWPNAQGKVGNFELSSSCTTEGIMLLYRTNKNAQDAKALEAMGMVGFMAGQWTALFPDKPVLCEAEKITPTINIVGSPPNPSPYYRLVTSPNGATAGCAYGDDNRLGVSVWGSAYCPAGYKVVGGGSSCGTETTASANMNWGMTLTNSGGQWGLSAWCCKPTNLDSGSTYVVCIRD